MAVCTVVSVETHIEHKTKGQPQVLRLRCASLRMTIPWRVKQLCRLEQGVLRGLKFFGGSFEEVEGFRGFFRDGFGGLFEVVGDFEDGGGGGG
jgi:hypothetical protein